MIPNNTERRSEDYQLITAAAVAEMLGLNVRYVLQLPIRRVVLGHRTIRYRKQDVDTFITTMTSARR